MKGKSWKKGRKRRREREREAGKHMAGSKCERGKIQEV